MINLGVVHLVDGEGGRVGRSFVAQAMFYFCLSILGSAGQNKCSLSEVEGAISSGIRRQRNSRNFGSFYAPKSNNDDDEDVVSRFVDFKYRHIPLLLVSDKKYLWDSRVERKYLGSYGIYGDLYLDVVFGVGMGGRDAVNSIFEAAMKRVVVVDVGSQSEYVVRDWWNCDEMAGLIENIPTRFVRWFVCDGERKSLDLFVDSVDRYSERMTHVLVKNDYRHPDRKWDFLDESPYLEAIEKSLVIDFPVFEGFCHGVLELADSREESHPVHGFISEFSACFTESGQFDALIEFSKAFKLQGISGQTEERQRRRPPYT
ncbi:MAG: hypothetical protein F6K24_01520 [Okeania sp. SIO2D1]|nr:hypothetical protein [Okeania sp. SIO2D1]